MLDTGQIIRALRKAKGLSQTELAAQIGVTKSMINKYESGVRSPSLEALSKICYSLNISPEQLLGIYVDKNILCIQDLTEEQFSALLVVMQAFHKENQ